MSVFSMAMSAITHKMMTFVPGSLDNGAIAISPSRCPRIRTYYFSLVSHDFEKLKHMGVLHVYNSSSYNDHGVVFRIAASPQSSFI